MPLSLVRSLRLLAAGAAFLLTACSVDPLFRKIPASRSGLAFENRIRETDSLNILDFEYIYNGAGVGIGDFNRDGLQDIFFAGNQVSSKLFLNKGNLTFEDVTGPSGIQTPFWSTGVAVADVNQDGWLDIYLCTIHPDRERSAPNQLFLNEGPDANGTLRFTEVAARTGLDDRGYSTQAAFLDYDRDGDLDVYILTNALEFYDRNLPKGQTRNGTGRSTDRLYRNEGTGSDGLPRFKDVSREAGITIEGWGLGIAVSDINLDGWPDIYCANDFMSNDLLWINERGTFTNRIGDYLDHQSSNSMGTDIADINNDGLVDIMTLDMMPEDNLRQKMMFSKQNYERYKLNAEKGYEPQFVRNMLQLNRGPDPTGQIRFSEIAQLAGVHATDWSWSCLFADFDHDGFRDLFVTNGYLKDVTSLDFINYNPQSSFSFRPEDGETKRQRLKKMEQLLGVRKSNFMFRNSGDLSFTDMTDDWGLYLPSFSNGAAYADLDNDGDLDIVTNNINDDAFLYENTLMQRERAGAANFLRIELRGTAGNLLATGARVALTCGTKRWTAEHSPYRGYKSSVDPVLHIGLGTAAIVDTLAVTWPDGRSSVLTAVAVNRLIVVQQDTNSAKGDAAPRLLARRAMPVLTELAATGLDAHVENDFIDFKRQVLLPHMHSRSGPSLAVADVNGDGNDDVFIGSSIGGYRKVYVQSGNVRFSGAALDSVANAADDGGAVFFDVDGDSDQDLYVASGGSEFIDGSDVYKDALYLNDGAGVFSRSDAVPPPDNSGSCVAVADFDNDGDLDVFRAGRLRPQYYPLPPRSWLLRNSGGVLSDATADVAPQLLSAGMVTAALWSDFDADGWIDLIIAGEFMPVRFYKNKNGRLEDVTPHALADATTGWWWSLAAGDFDNDGDVDYLAGNFGLNNRFNVSAATPMVVFAKDFDRNGSVDPVFSSFIQGRSYPIHPRDQLVEQIPAFKKKFTSFAQYGSKTTEQVLTADERAGSLVLKAALFASCLFRNDGGNFSVHRLPMAAQFGPVNGICVHDFDRDGSLDALLVGNDFSTDVQVGRYDAQQGLLLIGDGKGGFEPLSPGESGVYIPGDAKHIAKIASGSAVAFLATNNNGPVQLFRPTKAAPLLADAAGAYRLR